MMFLDAMEITIRIYSCEEASYKHHYTVRKFNDGKSRHSVGRRRTVSPPPVASHWAGPGRPGGGRSRVRRVRQQPSGGALPLPSSSSASIGRRRRRRHRRRRSGRPGGQPRRPAARSARAGRNGISPPGSVSTGNIAPSSGAESLESDTPTQSAVIPDQCQP